MKRIITIVLLMTLLIFTLSACESTSAEIEDNVWKMRTIIQNNYDASVPAVGIVDDLYPDAPIIDITMTAEEGLLVVTDATNNAVYEGTYTLEEKNPSATTYKITLDGQNGYAAAALTEYSNGSRKPTVTINLGEYSIYFVAA